MSDYGTYYPDEQKDLDYERTIRELREELRKLRDRNSELEQEVLRLTIVYGRIPMVGP